MKNWKCIIGATVLTPICAGLIFAGIVGVCWLIDNVWILKWIISGIASLVMVTFIWFALFDHCKEHWQKGKEGKL